MDPWLFAALALLPGFIACGIVLWRATMVNTIVALNVAGVLATLEFVLLAEGFHNPAFFELGLVLAVLTPAGSLIFLRFLERWI
jgi:multicomponent Na+:H+ antiporter subunit F